MSAVKEKLEELDCGVPMLFFYKRSDNVNAELNKRLLTASECVTYRQI